MEVLLGYSEEKTKTDVLQKVKVLQIHHQIIAQNIQDFSNNSKDPSISLKNHKCFSLDESCNIK